MGLHGMPWDNMAASQKIKCSRESANGAIRRLEAHGGVGSERMTRTPVTAGADPSPDGDQLYVRQMFFWFVTSGTCGESILISEYIAAEGSSTPQYIAVGRDRAPAGRGARRPVSRVLSVDVRPRDGHSSGAPVAGRLARPTRAAGPETDLARSCDRTAPPLLGLAPGGVCHAAPVAGRAVRSYRTLSPLLAGLTAPSERSALCGTFPGVAPAGRYPAPCSRGARTFLRRTREAATAAIRPSGRP